MFDCFLGVGCFFNAIQSNQLETPVSSSFSMSDQLPLDQWIANRVGISAKFVSDFSILYTQYFKGATCILCAELLVYYAQVLRNKHSYFYFYLPHTIFSPNIVKSFEKIAPIVYFVYIKKCV